LLVKHANAVIAFRKSNGKSYADNFKDDANGSYAIGNPFNWKDENGSRKEQGVLATKKFIDWLVTGNAFGNTDASEAYRNLILDNIKNGNLKDKAIGYFQEGGYPTHATALDYLVNEYNWGFKPVTEEVTPAPIVETVTEATLTSSRLAVLDKLLAEPDKAAELSAKETETLNATEDEASRLRVLNRIALEHGWEGEVGTTASLNIKDTNIIGDALNNAMADANGEAIITKLFGHKFNSKNVLHLVKNALTDPVQYQALYDVMNPSQQYSLTMLKNFHDQMFPLIRNILGFANKTGLPFRDANPAEYLYSKELQAIYDAAEDKSNIPLRVRHAKTQFIEDNLVSAMVLSAYSWIGEGSSKTLENYYDNVQKILGYKKDEVLPKGAMEEFRYVGLVTTSLIESLGKDAMKIMGLTKLATTEEGLTNKMPMALGTYIHLAMLEAGLVTINTVPNATIDKFAKQSSKKTEFSIVNPDGSVRETKQIHTEYTRVKVREFKLDGQAQIEVDPQVQQHIDAVRTSRSLLSEFFGAPKKETWPSLKPLKKAANRIRNSMMQMPEIIRKAVQKMQEAAWQVDLDRWSLFNFMDTPTQEAFVGVVSDEVLLTQKHIAERDKIEATNFGYRRELANWQDFISKLVQVPKTGLNTPFFFKAVGIRNGRFMINSNTVNPEASKIHRFLMNMKAWQVEIPADKNSKLYKNFIMAVGLSFGVKLDEMEPDAAINESLKRMRDPIMIEAMEWIKAARSMNYQMDAEQKAEMQASLIKAMKLGGEKMHTFAALEAMSHMEKGKPFKTSLFMEVDGKTNGPAIAMYQYLGFPMSKFRAASDRVGIYSDGTQTYAEWKGNRPDSFDSYQQLAVWMGGAFNTLLQNHKPRSKLATRKAEYEFAIKGKEAAFANLRSMIGEFTERDVNTRLIKISSKIRTLHKPPVMTNVYGIGFGKLVDEYVEGLIAQLYVDLRTAYLKGEEDKVTSILKAIAGSVDSLNSTTNPDGSVDDEFTFQNQADLNDKGVMEWQLNAEQHKALNAFLTATYGNALGVVFDQQYKQFINNRKTINDSMNAIFVVFKEVYYHRAKALVRKRVQAKYDALPEDKKSAAARKILEKNTTLTFEEISTLRTEMLNLTPLFKGPFSSSDPNNHMDSVLLLKDKQKVRVKDDMEDEYAYKAMVKVTDEYGNTREIPQYASKGTFEQPGASPGVLGVQTIDAAAQALQQIMHDNIMNLFDANAMALDKIDSTEEGMGVVESFNKHLYEIGLRDYRLRMAVAASLERVVAALKNEPTHIQEKANDAFLELGLKDSNWNEYGSLQSFTEDMSDKAAADNQQINTLVKRISHMSHFPFPGTSYEVPRNTSTETVVAEIGELVQEAKKEVILQEIITRYKSYRQFDRYKFTTLERILRMHYEGKQPTKKDRKIYDMVARELLLDWLQEQPLTRFVLPTNFKDTYLSRQNFERALDVVVAGLKVNKEYAESIQRVAKEFKGVAGTVTQSAAVAPTAPTVPTAPAVTTRQSPEQQAAEQSAKYVKFLLDTDAFSEFSETVVAKAVELNYKYSNIDDVKNEKSRNFVRKIRAAIRAYEEFEEQVFLDRLGKPPLDTKIFNSEAKYAATQAANEIGTEAEILRERAELNALLNRGRGTTTSRTASTSQSTSTEAPVHTEGPFRGQKMTPIEIALQNAQRNMDAEFAAEEQAMKDQMDAFNKRMGRSPARFTEEDLLKEREAAKEAARNKNTLGSAPGTPVNRADFAGQTGTVLDSSNVQRELQSMFNMGAQKDSATHKERLEKVVREIGIKILGPYEMYTQQKGKRSVGMTDMNAMYINVGNQIMSQLDLSAAEVYTHELVHKVVAYALDNNPLLRTQTAKLYKQVRAELLKRAKDQGVEPHMLLVPQNATTADVSAALKMYNYIFDNTRMTPEQVAALGTNMTHQQYTNNYLHEFMAYGLTNETIGKLLESMTADQLKDKKPTTFLQKVIALYDKFMDYILVKTLRSDGFKTGTAGDRLYALGQALSETHTHHTGLVDKAYGKADRLILGGVTTFLLKPLVKLANTNFIQNNRFSLVYAAGTLVNSVATHGVQPFRKAVEDLAKRSGLVEEGFILHTMAEILPSTTPAKIWEGLHRYSLAAIDQLRKDKATTLTKQLIKMYLPVPGEKENLSQKEKTAITALVLRADIGSLLSSELEQHTGFSYSLSRVRDMIADDRVLAREIQAIEQLIDAPEYGINSNHYIRQARSLGHLMARDSAIEEHTMSNAYTIANLFALEDLSNTSVQAAGIQKRGNLDKAEGLIDALASLYAIKYTDHDTKQDFLTVYNRETPRGLESGLNFTIHAQETFKQLSFDKLFDKQKVHVRKGYIKEAYDPYLEFKIASEADEQVLFNRGFTKQSQIMFDSNDPAKRSDMYLYTNDTGRPNRIRGNISLTNEMAKGADLIKVRNQQNDPQAFTTAGVDLMRIKATKLNAVLDQFSSTTQATLPVGNTLVPVVASSGEISSYRYMMDRPKKEKYLHMQDPFDVVMGKMLGSITDKVNTKEVNKEVVRLAYEDYRMNYLNNAADFTAISMSSFKAKDRELYYLLPKDMRKEIKNKFGGDIIYIRTSMLKLVFGYKQWSITDLRDKQGGLGSTYRLLLKMFGVVSAGKVTDHNIRKIENLWQEVVGLAKDTIVIKSVDVLAGNIMSNLVLLWARGVPLKDILKHSHVAIVNSRTYQKDKERLQNLEREFAYDPTRKALASEIARLQEDLARNPVAELINAGVYQSIVEDVESFDLPESYQTPLEKLVSPVKGRIPKKVDKVLAQVALRHDTTAYKILRDATQLSDFTARYVMHQHNVKVKKMDRTDSVNDIVKTFVNYDIPTHEGLDYANRMGLAMFTKYFLRIQQIVVALAVEHPSKILMLGFGELLFGAFSDITDSSVLSQGLLSHLQNPLDVLPGLETAFTTEFAKDAASYLLPGS
jgi:hypothetical protein